MANSLPANEVDDQVIHLVNPGPHQVEGNNGRKRTRDVFEQANALGQIIPDDDCISNASSPAQRDLNNPVPMIFRKPSEASKKYARPPLGKIFMDLQLDPLLYTRLEKQAKRYMLDNDHPERRRLIGGDPERGGDEARLVLRCATEAFLATGAGEEYWEKSKDPDAQYAPDRTLFWPEDRKDITKALMPLIRKICSNEHQRIYAQARRNEKKRSRKEPQSPSTLYDLIVIDDDAAPSPALSNASVDITSDPAANVTILVNILSAGKGGETIRLVPRFTISARSLTDFVKLQDAIKSGLTRHRSTISEVEVELAQYKAMLETGLADINNDGDLTVALASCDATVWMDGELRLLVFI